MPWGKGQMRAMAEPINPVFPVAAIRDARHLMEIAVAMESEAARRYGRLSAAMDKAGEPELAGLFADLATLEQTHEDGLRRWASRQGVAELATGTPFAWPMPETFEADDPLILTPYKALAIAVRNEERAFSFFTYLAALAPNDHVRSLAESMAREELAHVAELRAMRRRAFQSHPPDDLAERVAAAATSVAALERAAGGLENGSEELYDLAAREMSQAGDQAGATILREAARMSRLLSSGGRPAGRESAALAAARAASLLGRGNLTRSGVLKLCLRNAEEVLEIYLGIAERTADTEVLSRAQQLAESAVARLAMVRSLLPLAEE